VEHYTISLDARPHLERCGIVKERDMEQSNKSLGTHCSKNAMANLRALTSGHLP